MGLSLSHFWQNCPRFSCFSIEAAKTISIFIYFGKLCSLLQNFFSYSHIQKSFGTALLLIAYRDKGQRHRSRWETALTVYRKSSNQPFGGLFTFFGFLHGGLFKGAYTVFLVDSHIPFEIFLLINFFKAAHTSNRIFLRDRQIFVT